VDQYLEELIEWLAAIAEAILLSNETLVLIAEILQELVQS